MELTPATRAQPTAGGPIRLSGLAATKVSEARSTLACSA